MNRWLAPGVWLASVLLIGCTPQPRVDTELDNVRTDLEQFMARTELSSLVPILVAEAERAVREAGQPGIKDDERQHRIRLATKRMEIARAVAFEEQARQQVEEIGRARTALLLKASRMEVEQARQEVERARLESSTVREEMERARLSAMTAEELREEAARREAAALEEAEAARRLSAAQATEIELARREAELAMEAANTLRRRLELMELRQTDRGVVITLGDVLFEVGETRLQPSAHSNLEDVAELLRSEPDKRVRIEGHTDSSGRAEFNQRISLERAEAVRAELVALGIDGNRIQAIGMGEDFPLASNDTTEGRRRNRRVDVILLDD